MHIKDLIKEYLTKAKLLQLATSLDSQPWVCSVWFGADDSLNIYWFSSTTRRHSQELKKNRKVAGAIVLPQTPKDAPRGLQFEGIAQELTSLGDIQRARSHYEGRIFGSTTIDELINNPEKPHRFYQLKPTKFVLFDAVNFPEQSRQELEIK